MAHVFNDKICTKCGRSKIACINFNWECKKEYNALNEFDKYKRKKKKYSITKHPYYCWLTKLIYKVNKDIKKLPDNHDYYSQLECAHGALIQARTKFRIMMKKGLI